jgi:hypothetical protein
MDSVCQTYVGGDPVPATHMMVGPLQQIAAAGTVHVDITSGYGDPGEYEYQISDTDVSYQPMFTRDEKGIAMFVLGSPVMFHRLVVIRPPALGTSVKVCLVV